MTDPGASLVGPEWRVFNKATSGNQVSDLEIKRDTASGTGQPFDGKVSVVSTDLVTHNGEPVFLDADDAANTTYYVGDSTHPGILGAQVRVTGRDTPQYGIAAGL